MNAAAVHVALTRLPEGRRATHHTVMLVHPLMLEDAPVKPHIEAQLRRSLNEVGGGPDVHIEYVTYDDILDRADPVLRWQATDDLWIGDYVAAVALAHVDAAMPLGLVATVNDG